MGLNIDEVAVEQLLRPFDGQRLGDIDELAAAIIATAGIALRIFVRQDRSLGLENRAGDDVLGGDQLDLVLLAPQFLTDRPKERSEEHTSELQSLMRISY